MTTTCARPACGEPSHDGRLCRGCTTTLRGDLRHLPEHWRNLTEVYSRQNSPTGRRGRDTDTPIPFSEHAARIRRDTCQRLAQIVAELDYGDTRDLAPNVRAYCRWLTDRIERIRGHQHAGQIANDIHSVARTVRLATDPVDDRLYCGLCPICGAPLYAKAAADTVTCHRCAEHTTPGDDTEPTHYDVAASRASMFAAVDDRQLPRAQVIRAVLLVFGIDVNQSTFRSWIARDQLRPEGYTEGGTPLYRLGHVLELARGGRSEAS